MPNIGHLTVRPIESNKSDPTNKANPIEFDTFDPADCTRLITTTYTEKTRVSPEHLHGKMNCQLEHLECQTDYPESKSQASFTFLGTAYLLFLLIYHCFDTVQNI